MDEHDSDRDGWGRRLVLSREDFDDYLVVLNTKIRRNDDADRVLADEFDHPFIAFEDNNFHPLTFRSLRPPHFWVTQLSRTKFDYVIWQKSYYLIAPTSIAVLQEL